MEQNDLYGDLSTEIYDLYVRAQKGEREAAEELLNTFIQKAKFDSQHIHPMIPQYAAEVLERIIGGEEVDSLIGKRRKGSPGKESYKKKEQNKKIAINFLSKILKGFSKTKARDNTATECGVSTRSVERKIGRAHV